jgi:MFS family permease
MTFGELLSLWQQTVSGVLSLDPATFQTIVNHPQSGLLALLVALPAGISAALGQSVVLFANRVSRRRFLVSLFMFALGLVASLFFWAGAVWIVAGLLFTAPLTYRDALILAALSEAPLLFGFLILLPYLGNIISPLLRVWALLALITGVMATAGLPLWQAALCAGLGWLLMELVIRLPISRWKAFENLWFRLSTGAPAPLTADEVVSDFVRESRETLTGRTADDERAPA